MMIHEGVLISGQVFDEAVDSHGHLGPHPGQEGVQVSELGVDKYGFLN